MLTRPNKAETAVHGFHCPGDMAVRMRKGWCSSVSLASIVVSTEVLRHTTRRKPLRKGATSRFGHLEKFSLNFSSSLFVIHVNLLCP